MENDNDLQADIPEVAELPQVQDGQQDTTDWKAIAKQNQEALTKMQGMTKRFQTKLKKLTEAPKPQPEAQKQNQPEKKGFDYAEKAYLKSSGINSDEFDFVKEVMDATGKPLDQVLEAKYFQTELKERRDVKATADATPSSTKRAGNSTRNDVDYWIAKGELPPADQPELRRKVVNAKIVVAKGKNQFSDDPVIRG
jgi:hypothetical protein